MSFTIRYLDFETLDCYFMHISDKIIYHVLNDVEDIKKNIFQYKNISVRIILLKKYTNTVSLRTVFTWVSL